LVEIACANDEFSFIILLKACSWLNVEDTVCSVTVVGCVAAALCFENVNVLRVNLLWVCTRNRNRIEPNAGRDVRRSGTRYRWRVPRIVIPSKNDRSHEALLCSAPPTSISLLHDPIAASQNFPILFHDRTARVTYCGRISKGAKIVIIAGAAVAIVVVVFAVEFKAQRLLA
jgi:hypothetical protein